MSKTGFYKGRLGIGLTSTMGMGDGNPRYPLDINGDIRLTGAIVNGDGLALNMVNPDSMWNVGSNIISYSAGNVGIGTTDPGIHALRVMGTTSAPMYGQALKVSTNGSCWLELEANAGGSVEEWGIAANSGGELSFYKRHGTGSAGYKMTLLGNGNLGIGTTSPASHAKLHINGDSASTYLCVTGGGSGNSYKRIQLGTTADANRIYSSRADGTHATIPLWFNVSNGNAPDMAIKENGNVGIGTTSPYAKLQISGTSTNPSTSTQSSTSSQGILRLHGTGGLFMDFGFLLSSPYTGWIQTHNGTTNGTGDDLALQPVSGNVGIGTTSPNAKLDVNGNIYANGLIYLSTHVQHIGDNDTKIGFNGDDQYEVRVGGVQAFQCEKFNSYSVVRFGGASATGWGVTFPSPLGCYSRGKMYVAHDFVVTGDCHLATSSGKNVGIGTASPGYKLEIKQGKIYLNNSNTWTDTEAANTKIYLGDTNFGVGSGHFTGDGAGEFTTLWSYNGAGRGIRFCATGNGGANKFSDFTTHMIIQGNTGYVGIGTNDPACGLELADEASLKSGMKFGRFMGAGYREYFPSSGTYASFSTDNHGSFTIGNNCHIDTNNNIEYNNTHGTMKGPAICMPGNAQPHQGSIIFYTADPGSVTAGHTFKTIGNTPTMHLDHNGYVGINEGAPEARLHIYSGTQCMRMVVPFSSKYFQTNFYYGGHHIDVYYHGSTKGFGSTGNGGSLHLNYYSSGNVTVSGGTNATSDDRIKHNEKIITNGLDIINQLEPKKYFKSLKRYDEDHNYDLDSSGNPITDDDYKIETGLIAQQVMIIDDLKYTVDEVEDKYKTVEKETLDENGDVILDDDGKPVIEKKEEIALKGRYTVKYQDIFVYNIAATQELYKENQELKTEVATLKSELAAIKQHLGI